MSEANGPTRHRGVVLTNRPEGRDARRLDIQVDGPWAHRPGQVAELSVTRGDEGYFAIASPPGEGGRLSFLVRAGGSLSEPLMTLPVGAEVSVSGPWGRGYDLDARGTDTRPLLLVGVGSALGALRSPLLDALATRVHWPVTLVLGVRTLDDVGFADELDAWRAAGAEIHLVVSRSEHVPSPSCFRGHVQDHLVALASRSAGALVLLAGSEAFEDEVTAVLVGAGVATDRIQRNFRPDGRPA